MSNTAIVSVGSNIEPEKHVAAARRMVAEQHELVACSEFIRTEPIGRPGQPHYLNGALMVRTPLERREFRRCLKQIEDSLGRVRGADKFAARRIDLDIVVWNGEIVDKDYYSRDFLRDSCCQLLPGLSNGGA